MRSRPQGKFPQQKAKDFKGSIRKLFDYLKPYYMKFIFVFFFAIGSTVFTIFGPRLLAKATDTLSEGVIAKVTHTGGIPYDKIATILVILTTVYFLSAFLQFVQGFMLSTISQKVACDLRNSISQKISRLPLTYFDTHSHGDTLSRVTNDVDLIAQSFNQSLTQMMSATVTIIGILVMMLSINIVMTIVVLLILPLSSLIFKQIMKKTQKYFRQQQASLGQVNGYIEEIYGAHEVMKAFNGEETSSKQFQQYNDALYQSAWKSQFFSGMMQPLMSFIGNVNYVFVCFFGGYLATRRLMTIGDILAFIQYARQFNQPITQIAQMMNQLQATAAAAERVFEFLEESELEAEVSLVSPEEYQDIEGSVTFDHVQFGYQKDQIIIHDMDLHVHAGQSVAIVGPTGAGKTTIVKLLMRFYELNNGNIFIDGHNITDMTRHDLRHLFGMVLQDTWLFHGTLRENLKYGHPEITDEDMIKAAQLAYADDFIRTLEHGYDTVIEEDSQNISSGQKQLLTIARAFLVNPKILILDEATSSVDTRTEILIQKGMENLMKGRTSFIIAHRLSTIKDAHTIIVMKDGDIIEIGNHKELLNKNGFYAELYQSQFENS